MERVVKWFLFFNFLECCECSCEKQIYGRGAAEVLSQRSAFWLITRRTHVSAKFALGSCISGNAATISRDREQENGVGTSLDLFRTRPYVFQEWTTAYGRCSCNIVWWVSGSGITSRGRGTRGRGRLLAAGLGARIGTNGAWKEDKWIFAGGLV